MGLSLCLTALPSSEKRVQDEKVVSNPLHPLFPSLPFPQTFEADKCLSLNTHLVFVPKGVSWAHRKENSFHPVAFSLAFHFVLPQIDNADVSQMQFRSSV